MSPKDQSPAPRLRSAPGSAVGPPAAELLDELAALLSGPRPNLLVIEGPPGSGKSSLLRSLRDLVRGPKVHVVYRVGEPAPASEFPHRPASAGVSVALVGSEGVPSLNEVDSLAALPIALRGAGPASKVATEGLPVVILRAVDAMASQGGGCLFLDQWDRSPGNDPVGVEQDGAAFGRLLATAGELNARLSDVPVHTVAVLLSPANPDVKSAADAAVRLGSVRWDGPSLRVVTVEKFHRNTTLAPRHLFTLDGGVFRAPARIPRGFVPPLGTFEPDPSPTTPGWWPGSSEFAGAWGRLPEHSLVGLELGRDLPSAFVRAIWLPMVVEGLRSGGHVVVIPPVSTIPSELVGCLRDQVPAGAVRASLRVLSPVGSAGAEGVPPEVLLPLPKREPALASAGRPGAVVPQLPEAFEFLAATPRRRPALFVIAVDGLRAITAITGIEFDVQTVPLVMGVYARLPGFCGVGLARSDDPMQAAFLPSLALHLRLELREGVFVAFQPEGHGPCFFVQWAPGHDRRYRLVRAS